MKHRRRWSTVAVTVMSLVVTVPPSFVATNSHKIVIEVGPNDGTATTVVGTEPAQSPALVVQIGPR